MAGESVRTRRWTRLEYERLVAQGFFRPDDRIELLEGRLVVKEPQSAGHAAAAALVTEALRAAFGVGWLIRPGYPVALGRWSEPEPDICVVRGAPRDYAHAHPAEAALVVEVSQSRLRFDRTRKAAVYARAGIPDYWIVNLIERRLEVRRDPALRDARRRRWAYRAVQSFAPADVVSPLAVPGARIPVADLLP